MGIFHKSSNGYVFKTPPPVWFSVGGRTQKGFGGFNNSRKLASGLVKVNSEKTV